MFWLSSWSWSVLAVFETSAVASEVAVCDAVLGPDEMLPPAIEVGELPLTAFWSLFATPTANCSVLASWTPTWKPPFPPQPAEQPPSLPPPLGSLMSVRIPRGPQPQLLAPTFWFSVWSWSVLALLETSVVADELAVCEAVLGPELTLPPAIDTGTFAFTAFWSLLATPAASWPVCAFWIPAW